MVIALRIDDASAHCNRGVALAKLGLLDEAIAAYQAALSFKPDFPEAYFNWGNALQLLSSYEMALAAYDQAIAIRADYAQAHWNKSMALLLRGELENGFKLFEWRWRCSAFTSKQRNFKQALWLGAESLQGKTILLHAEQGMGDTIQFCRYCEAVHALGAIVLLEVQAPLVGLLASLRGVSRLIKRGDPLPEFDFHCPLMSLPLALKTGLDSIPAAPHYLRADSAKVALWKNRLGEKTIKRVGLVWSGSQIHRNDKTRSIPLANFIGSLPPGFEYISLQKENRTEDGPVLMNSNIKTFESELHDFSDTAALCDLMDLIISVDTSVAHLAGALGKRVFLFLPHIPDWRWMLQRDHSPWYPSMRIFRLNQNESWSSLLRTCANEIVINRK